MIKPYMARNQPNKFPVRQWYLNIFKAVPYKNFELLVSVNLYNPLEVKNIFIYRPIFGGRVTESIRENSE